MARSSRKKPELPPAAYRLAEMHHLGQPLTMYRTARLTEGLGCVLTIIGFVCAMPLLAALLGPSLSIDPSSAPTLFQVARYSVALFLLIAFLMVLPRFLTRNVRVYVCTNGLISLSRKVSKREVIFWEDISSVEGPTHSLSPLSSRRSLFAAILFSRVTDPGYSLNGGRASHSYCMLHLLDGSTIAFSQAITNLGPLEQDIRKHLRHAHVP